MCGIAGYSHRTPLVSAMLPYLLWEIESRGHDSWGATDGDREVKALGPVTDSFHRHANEIASWDRAIFHTRASSTGSVSIPNQHPFTCVAEDRKVVGIHNGIIGNHSMMNAKYHRSFDVDSQHIFAHIVERKPTGELYGWGNCAWYEMNSEFPLGRLHLLRFNNDALHIAQMQSGELIFCSTAAPIRRAAHMCGGTIKYFYDTKEEYIYTVEPDEHGAMQLWKSSSKLPFGMRSSYTPVGSPNGWPGGTGRGGYRPTRTTSDNTDFLAGLCCVTGCREKTVSGSRKTTSVCKRHWEDALAKAACVISRRRQNSSDVVVGA
jgi:hypothetical protein